jgi:uroporphyrinogen-III decarboxylase
MLKQIPLVFSVLKPEFVVLSEDMSYNGGPMISEEHFDEFMLPYYNQIIPEIKKYGVKVIIDSDGDITNMIPWFIRAGIDGVLPLERKAGVDIAELSTKYPSFIFLGGYDKMVMSKSRDDMVREFERLLPPMKSGNLIPSCDHQTPPEVSLENYRIYVELLKEYASKACQ